MDLFVLGKAVLFGGLLGAGYAAIGYFKPKKIEKFDRKKFAVTIIIAAIVGALAGGSGMSFEQMEHYLITTGGFILIEMGAKVIVRRLNLAPEPKPKKLKKPKTKKLKNTPILEEE